MSTMNPIATGEIRTRSNYPSTQTPNVLNCGSFSGRIECGYLRFPDLSSLSGATINSATLILKQISGGYTSTLGFNVSLCNFSVNWSSINYTSYPTAVRVKACSLYGTSAGLRYFDVTDIVQYIADNTLNYTTWELRRTSSSTYDGKNFSTSYGDHSLVINYAEAAPSYTVSFTNVPIGCSCKVTDDSDDTAIANRLGSSSVDVIVDDIDYSNLKRVAIFSEADGYGDELCAIEDDNVAYDDEYDVGGLGEDVVRWKNADYSGGATVDLGVDSLTVNGALNIIGALSASVGAFGEWVTWTPTWTFDGGTIQYVDDGTAIALRMGNIGFVFFAEQSFTISGSNSYTITLTLPSGWVIADEVDCAYYCGLGYGYSGAAYAVCPINLDYANDKIKVVQIGQWIPGSGRTLYGAFAVVPLNPPT